MPTIRISTIAIVTAVVAIAVATASFTSRKAAHSSDDFALRHPQGLWQVSVNPAAYYLGSDYAARHQELSRLGNSIDSSDFFLRHPEWLIAPETIDTSDYFLRHQELSAAVVDTTDYFLRHPEFNGQ